MTTTQFKTRKSAENAMAAQGLAATHEVRRIRLAGHHALGKDSYFAICPVASYQGADLFLDYGNRIIG